MTTAESRDQGTGIRDQKEPAQVRMIALDLLDENPLNPRRSMDEGALNELAASIKASGISQPLLVRPEDIEGLIEERYEIVCGHRRAQAATIAELDEVPCIVRAMTDQEAAEIALVDNLQRVDVAALDEAEAFGKLLVTLGSIAAVAARVGKDVAHVAKRLRLRTLGTWQRDALLKTLITVDHALLLARLGVAEQDAALKWALDPSAGSKTPVDKVIAASWKYLRDDGRHRQWEPESVVRLREHIEQSVGRKLSRAPWNLAATNLDEMGMDCLTCPNNTKANAALFSDLDIDEATCADGGCFERKRETYVHIQLTSAPNAIRLSWRPTSTPPRMELGEPCKGPKGVNNFTQVPKLTQIFKAGQWIEAKKGSCANILTGVTVDWSDDGNRGYMGRSEKLRKPGEVIQVCVAAKCKAHRKEWEKPKCENVNLSSRLTPAEEKAAQQKREAEAAAETKLRVALVAKALEGVTSIPINALCAMAIEKLPDWPDGRKEYEALLPGLIKILAEAKAGSAQLARAFALASIDRADLVASEYHGPEHNRSDLVNAVRRLGYKGAMPWDKPAAAKAEKPKPKPAAAKPAKKAATKKAAK